jgi:glucan endo-1,3-alpha-glucosidase
MRSLSSTALILGLSTLLSLNLCEAGDNPHRPTRKVFARYMVCCPRVGGKATVADLMAEIREAQARGIDGFVLCCGRWSKREPQYKARTLLIYEAAKRLNTGFQLSISADLGSADFGEHVSPEEMKDMIDAFRNHPNQFKWDGKPVLTTFGGNGRDNKPGQKVIDLLDREFPDGKGGRTVVYVPYYFPRPDAPTPLQANVDQVFNTFPRLDGYFYFGAAGEGAKLAQSNALLADRWVGAGKIYMASVSPFYRGLGVNYRVFESNGFDGMIREWKAAIEHRATWVQIVTWNDWGEATYVAPFGDAKDTELWNGHWGKQVSHTGFLDAMRYYIDWYHHGAPPAVKRDQVFYAYRLHPKNVPGRIKPAETALGRPNRADSLSDSVFVMCLLKSPAKLTIHSGNLSKTFDLAAGMHHVDMPFALGKQRFVVRRDAKTVLEKTGEHEVTLDSWSNFNVFAGSATAD